MVKNAGRALALSLIGLVGGYALWLRCVVPFHCNRIEHRAETATYWALAQADPTITNVAARQNLERTEVCIRTDPTNANLYMIAAANYRILNRAGDAIRMYRLALQYDRRPEIYLQLGLSELGIGERAKAIESLTVSNLYFADKLDLIPMPDIRVAVEANTKAFFAAGRNATVPPLLRSEQEFR